MNFLLGPSSKTPHDNIGMQPALCATRTSLGCFRWHIPRLTVPVRQVCDLASAGHQPSCRGIGSEENLQFSPHAHKTIPVMKFGVVARGNTRKQRMKTTGEQNFVLG